jgi:hypothetical protein
MQELTDPLFRGFVDFVEYVFPVAGCAHIEMETSSAIDNSIQILNQGGGQFELLSAVPMTVGLTGGSTDRSLESRQDRIVVAPLRPGSSLQLHNLCDLFDHYGSRAGAR